MMRPSPSMVVAALALFVSLSGTSYAVSQLPAKSVGAKQLKPNAVTGAKVKDGSLSAKDFAAGQLPAGPAGPAGPTGPAGKGAASRSAWASAARSPGFVIPYEDTVMFSLTQFADVSTGALSLESASRLVISGSVNAESGDSRTSGTLSCRYEVRSPQGWLQASTQGQDWVPATSREWVTFTAVIDVEPGTTDVRLMCRSVEFPRIVFRSGHFTVIATDR